MKASLTVKGNVYSSAFYELEGLLQGAHQGFGAGLALKRFLNIAAWNKSLEIDPQQPEIKKKDEVPGYIVKNPANP